MESKRLICPDVENCSIYKKWAKKTGNKRLDIIIKYFKPKGDPIYICSARQIFLKNSLCLNEKIANITKGFEKYL